MTNEYNHIPVSDFPFKTELASFVQATYHEPKKLACMAACIGLDVINYALLDYGQCPLSGA